LWGETGLQTSFRNMVIFYVLNFAMFLIMLIPIRDMMPPVFLVRTLITTTCTAILNVWFCDASQLRWRLHRVFQYEMRRFDYILNDLLPSTFDQSCTHSADASGDHYIGKLKVNLAYDNYLRDSTLPFHHERNAIVLQLDLCSFTEFSRKISPMELAQTLHQLFSRFDSTVRSLNLFKMDTVGDAYIVSAWLTAHEADSIRQNPEYMPNARKSCHSVLWLAGMMLNTIDSYRTKDGHEITARIGVAVGTVVVGSLGSMQPRIHIRGYGMRKAEELEQQGTPGMVNVCDKFLNILSAAHIPANNSTSRDTFMEDPPQHARFVEGTRKRRGQKISWSRPDLDLQGWSIVETRRTSQAEDGDDEPTLGQGHNANNVSGLVGTSFILQRPPTAHWESNRGGEVLSSETPCRKPK
jgi:class 3 adenylate cyclase